MNSKIRNGLAAAAMLLATMGNASNCNANSSATTPPSQRNTPTEVAQAVFNQSPSSSSIASPSAHAEVISAEAGNAEAVKIGEVASRPAAPASTDASTAAEVPASPDVTEILQGLSQGLSPVASSPSAPAPAEPEANAEAMKVGEYQASERAEQTVAMMQSYEADGRDVTTLYVRNIPVLSFLGSEGSGAEASSSELKVSAPTAAPTELLVSQSRQSGAAASQAAENSSDPEVRATAIAARLNQLHRNQIDAKTIRAVWDESTQRYLVKVGEDTLTAIDPDTILADTTNNAEQDALQVANRLRRLLGNAEPLTEVEGAPRQTTISLGPVESTVSGYASWYGPGFNGNISASGEVFNENAMTAAHPSLPFGTQVKVTNMDNGLSVVVRINDRGPYVGDRVIDLSAGAADVIGLTNSGVAPVRLDILGAAAK
jgi:rare lipoprotein A